MKKKPSKTNLFRFVTLRNPQLVDENTNSRGFVYHPDTSRSNFITTAENSNDQSRKAVLETAHAAYNAMQNKNDLPSQAKKLYDFSSWLMRNKDVLSYASINENKNDAKELTESQELLMWENLLYYAIKNESNYVRDILIQTLVANQFLKAFEAFRGGSTEEITFTTAQEEEFVRRANAAVVIPEILTKGGLYYGTYNPDITSKEDFKREADAKRILLEREVETYQELRAEIEKIEILYEKENKKAFKEALDTYNKQVDDVIASNPNKEEPVDPTTESRSAELLAMDKATFEFTPKDAANSSYLSNRLSDKLVAFMKAQEMENEFFFHETLADVNEAIGKRIQERKSEIGKLTSPQPKNIRIGGNVVPLQTKSADNGYDYNFIPLHEQTSDGSRNILMQVFNDITGSNLTEMDYEITFPETGDSFSSDDSDVAFEIVSDGDFLMLALFPEGIVFPENATYYDIEGNIGGNGASCDFQRRIILKNRFNKGYFIKTSTGGGSTTDKKVFGLTSLGIADFRRVEQEISCYVPGEVSHIENILAREYKERSTRSLTSLQTETETTSEREVENLRDTTTTERNELQSETSAVINEDESQNYGATANLSYSPGVGGVSLNLGAYADFSSSTSTSNSNSQAQSYAQEVTERALERVVQKVSSRRTSIMLREFEENNTHGFDNTEGDVHITGVYRWVDKIYKNQLVNYGKRLIYEFTVPEPSRFFKEAIKQRIEGGNADANDMIEPIAPVTLASEGINSAADLTAENYQEIAGLYNAEVNTIPVHFLRVGKSFSHKFYGEEAQGHESFNRNARDYEMELPEGYRCSAVDIRGNIIREGDGGTASAAIYIGDNRYSFGTTSGWKDIHFDNAPLNNLMTGVLPISIATEDVEPINFNIVAHCYFSTEARQQWQNETYNAIATAYEERLAEYKDAKAIFDAPTGETTEDINFNPLFNRSLEQKELKRICIELMAEQCDLQFAKNHYHAMNPETCISAVNASKELQTHAEMVRFFEQVFDWDLMAYTLYPYFYADKKDWKDLFQERNGADPLFQAFLQSGMARVVLPIRPGFEAAANWYLETGELNMGQNITTDNELYLSILEDLQTEDGEVESTWETRVPTSLTIVQAKSAFLDEEGLPCFDPKGELENTILSSTETMKGDSSTTSTEGGQTTF